jgi:(1->4)-alpha-D-glucan 1-alpha-D-glucosylmutase
MKRSPQATYRVQLSPEFDFDAASDLVDYLASLGVSHLYSSPVLQAAGGSTHGYDVVDPTRVSVDLGGSTGHAELSTTLDRHGLAQLLDIVPNHMAITPDNPWWWDVLENGSSSRYADYFDVDWSSGRSEPDEILLPVLGDHYGRILEAGKLELSRDGGSFRLGYEDRRFPVDPLSLAALLGEAADRSQSRELGFIADALAALPVLAAGDADPERRHEDKEVLREQLRLLLDGDRVIREAVDELIGETNDDPDALDALIRRQHYRLAHWRLASEELDYRRFFDINGLIGLRVEAEHVFRHTHALVLDWVEERIIDGLRIDHPDGLRDPEGYLQRLCSAAPEAWVVVEKILEPGERLPESWAVAGTTGYDFMNLVTGLFVDPEGEEPSTAFYASFTGEPTEYPEVLRTKKHQVLDDLLASDLNRLVALLQRVCEDHRRHRDYPRQTLRDALRELVACFPVYRTYAQPDGTVSEQDVRHVDEALGAARERCSDIDPELFDFLRELLLLEHRNAPEVEFAMRFQQLTGPAMAKGAEDTAFYCYNRFVALNEVGGAPDRFGVSADDFHRWATDTHERHPRTLLATSTHDSKRSGDVRARLAVLSELPGQWAETVSRWSEMNEPHRNDGVPDRNTEYLLYQTLVGAWPISTDRLTAYMRKASREAKVHTSWREPDEEWETALEQFVTAILRDDEFVSSLQAFVEPLIAPGRVNSLAQTLIKLTAPGVPDIYQGTELWDLSLVDPDNRRPVDFERRRRLLNELESLPPEEILQRADEGLPKLWVIRQALHLRDRSPESFGPAGTYEPLPVQSRRGDHLIAFRRAGDVVTLVPRLRVGFGPNWGSTELEVGDGRWRNQLTRETFEGPSVRVGELLDRFPVALLYREENR